MNMNNIIESLAKTFNTLSLISTKGEDTIYMSECLKSIKNIYDQLMVELANQNNQNNQNKEQE